MLIRYHHHEDMYKQFALFLLERLPVYRQYHKKQRYINGLFILILNFFLWESWAPIIGITLLIYLLYPYLLKSGINSQINMIVDSWPLDEVAGLRELSLGPETLVETGSRGRQELAYSQLKNLAVDGQLIYLFFRAEEAIIVPVKALANAAETSAFLKFLVEKNPRLANPDLPQPAPKRFSSSPKQGSFGWGQAAVIVGLLAFLGAGALGYYFARGLWAPDLKHSQSQTDELFSGLSRVETPEELAAAVSRGGDRISWTYTVVEGLPGDKRCLVDLYFEDGEKREASPEQLAAFSFLKKEYPRLRPGMMSALLADYQKMRKELVGDDQGGQFLNMFLFPDIDSVKELEEHLGPARWRLHRETKDGLAYASVNFFASWLPDESYGALFLGDQMVFAGYEPEFEVVASQVEKEAEPESKSAAPPEAQKSI